MITNNICFKKIFFALSGGYRGRDGIMFPRIIPCDEFKRTKAVTQPLMEGGGEGGVVNSSHNWHLTKVDKNPIFSLKVPLQC